MPWILALLLFYSGQLLAVEQGRHLLLVVEAHLAKTDAMQLAAACAAQGALGTVYLAHRRGDPPRWAAPLGPTRSPKRCCAWSPGSIT